MDYMILNFQVLYHGSINAGINVLEPKKRFTPGNETDSPEAIYASDDPAFAAAHGFPWSSTEGVDLYYDKDENGRKCVHLEVPQSILSRLIQGISVYTVKCEGFKRVDADVAGKSFRSLMATKCLAEKRFKTVIEAVEYFGGKVMIKA